MTRILWITGLFCPALLCGTIIAYQSEKAEEKPKVSMVARNSPVLREYFREMYTKTFTDSLHENTLNRVLDDQIDEFVKRLLQKNLSLEEAAAQLSQSSDKSKQRQWIRRIRQTAGDLEGTLRIWSDSLRPTNKIREAEPSLPAPTVQLLLEDVAHYGKQIDQFLFPEEVAVSVKELQSEGFHRTLKRIQRIAQALGN